MIPILDIVFVSSVIAIMKRKRKQPHLYRKWQIKNQTSTHKKGVIPQQKSPAHFTTSLRAYFTLWDYRYQSLIQKRLDPKILGRVHSQQMQKLGKGVTRKLSPMEKSANRKILLGTGALGLLALSPLTSLPLIPVVIGIGLYSIKPALKEGWRVATQEKRFSLLHLMLTYICFLWFSGHYLIGTIGLIFINLNRKVELLVQSITRHEITHLLGEQPQTVWVLIDNCEIEIPFEQLQSGDILILNAGQSVPIDGSVVQGSATVDQHRLTGESHPIEKSLGDTILASTLVLGGRLEVQVEKTGAETAAATIGNVLSRTVERQETRLADQFQVLEGTRWPMLAAGTVGWVLAGPTTAVALLGCNYLMSMIPLRLMTLLNGLKTGAERGVLIKDGRALERFPSIDTVVFDKTGTLTLDQPQVHSLYCAFGYSEAEVLTYAAAAEQRQSHPIAHAILEEASARKLTLPEMDEAQYEMGLGLTARINGHTIQVGSDRFLKEENIPLPTSILTAQKMVADKGNALVFVAIDGIVSGAIELAATLRPETQEVISWFKQQGLKLYIISGDQEAPTRAVAEELGMDGYFANTLPEQKAIHIEELQAQGRKICFIGDGINDAIALRQADVSISLKGATTVATDAAQVVLMDNNLKQLILLWELARGFESSLTTNKRLATQFSLVATTGVILLPFKFWIVELLWGSQAITGLKVAHRALLNPSNDKRLPTKQVDSSSLGTRIQ